MKDVRKVPRWYTTVLYALGLFLFLEWLYPVKQITDFPYMNLFFIYTVLCFAITLTKLPLLLKVLGKGIGALLVMHQLYVEAPLLTLTWIIPLLEEVIEQLPLIFQQGWSSVTPLSKSLLFLIMIWLMSYFVHYWLVSLRHYFLFIVLTIVYVGALDSFTAYDASGAIIRIFVLSLLVLGMANFLKILNREKMNFQWFYTIKGKAIGSLLLLVFFVTFIGYAAPKWDVQWQGPLPYLKEATGLDDEHKKNKKIGYGEDDTQLGGSFVDDDTAVFQATTKEAQYWRVETKDRYTGKGWVKTHSMEEQVTNGMVTFSTYNDEHVETSTQQAVLTFQQGMDIPKIVYPYGVKEIITEEKNVHFSEDDANAIKIKKDKGKDRLNTYELLYEQPSYPYDILQDNERMEALLESDPFFQSPLFQQYTQLPKELPNRVHDLALDITKDYTGYFDKVQAIEEYFHQNGFVYQTSNIPIPGEEQDYVDQFLFDTKKGYCDNYSTAMVVLLRSLDIPARWVKGFTAGEKIDTVTKNGEAYAVFEVTNNNAHAWVEVFFPQIGWIPFEPTQGFTNLADFHTEEEIEETDELSDEAEQIEEEAEQIEEEAGEEAPVDATEETESSSLNTNIIYAVVLLFIVLLAILLYQKRLRIQTAWYIRKWEKSHQPKTFQGLYHHILRLLQQQGKGRERQQTLREYAREIDQWYEMDAMEDLTKMYEQFLYRNEQVIPAPEKVTELSKKIIKHIMG